MLYLGNSKHFGHIVSFHALVSLANLVVLAFDYYPHVYIGKFQVVHVQVVNGTVSVFPCRYSETNIWLVNY